ncbi:MAG: hypothetical protein AAGA56_23365, partial [Myxococcota bacterium]
MSRPGRPPTFLPTALALVVGGCVLDFDGLADGADTIPGSDTGGGSAGGPAGPGPSGSLALCPNPCPDGICPSILPNPSNILKPTVRVAGDDAHVVYADGTQVGVRDTSAAPSTEHIFAMVAQPTAVASNAAFIFAAGDGQGIDRCTFPDCSSPATVVAPTGPVGPLTRARQMVADDDHLFWIQGDNADDGGIFRCPVNGCASPEAIDTVDTSARRLPQGLAIDATYVFWTMNRIGDSDREGVIRRRPKNGLAEDVVDYALGVDSPAALALLDDTLVFTSNATEGGVFACTRDDPGGRCTDLYAITDGVTSQDTPIRSPNSVTVVGDQVVWTNDGDTTVVACPVSGCSDSPEGLPRVIAR